MTGEISFQKSPAPAWLNADLIQKALRNGEEDPTITVVSCDVSKGSPKCVLASDVYHVTATLENDEQRSVIVKCQTQRGMGKELAELFENEIKMLTETLPALHRLLENACPEEFKPLGPKCFFHGIEPMPFLVLEDLKELGFTFGRRKFGLDFAHCSMALKTLAHFHAASMALQEQNPEKMEYYTQYDFSAKFRVTVEDFLVKGVSSLADEVKSWPGYEKYSEKLLKMKDSMCTRFAETCRRKEGSLNVLINADAWATNLMVKYSRDSITDIRLNDFQTIVYASPIIELQHYLYACSNIDVQVNRTDELIKEYHDTLCRTLNFLGCPNLTLSWDDFLELYSDFNFYAFYILTTVFPPIINDLSEELNNNNSENKKTPSNDTKHFKGKVYRFLMQYFLPIYEEQGIL